MLKGKAKAPAEDPYEDFQDPPITYRHFLSQNLGIRDPFRVIALCDSDAFYAACEMVRLGIFDKPLVVLQWGALIAVNYPARKYGISRMDKVEDAKKRCPELIVIHVATYKEGQAEPGYWDDVDTNTHKVSLDYYRRESAKILTIFKDHLVGAEIEKASIDEAFMDLTPLVRKILLERYPFLATVPEDVPNGLDTALPTPPPFSWQETDCVIPIIPEDPDNPDGPSASSDGDHIPTWHDVALSIGAELMQQVRDEIRTKLLYTTSAGIARNKFLAKLSASYKKPNSQSILRNAAIEHYLKPMPFQKIRFLGGKLGKAIAKEYDVSTVEELLSVSLDEMQHKFGEDSIWVYEAIRGIDRAEVKDKPTINKSMLAAKNLPKPITKAAEGQHWIRVLAAELALRLKDAREANPNLWPKTLVLHARKGWESSRSKQVPFPFTRNATVDVIAAAGNNLWKDLVGSSTDLKITTVSLGFTGVELAEPGQQSIDGFFKTPKRPRDELDDDQSIETPKETDVIPLSPGRHSGFSCEQCSKRIELPDDIMTSGLDDGTLAQALATLRQEHEDFHFAQNLAKEGSTPIKATKSGRSEKRQRKEPRKGIEQFFNRK